jgi:hypothetical protein
MYEETNPFEFDSFIEELCRRAPQERERLSGVTFSRRLREHKRSSFAGQVRSNDHVTRAEEAQVLEELIVVPSFGYREFKR